MTYKVSSGTSNLCSLTHSLLLNYGTAHVSQERLQILQSRERAVCVAEPSTQYDGGRKLNPNQAKGERKGGIRRTPNSISAGALSQTP